MALNVRNLKTEKKTIRMQLFRNAINSNAIITNFEINKKTLEMMLTTRGIIIIKL